MDTGKNKGREIETRKKLRQLERWRERVGGKYGQGRRKRREMMGRDKGN